MGTLVASIDSSSPASQNLHLNKIFTTAPPPPPPPAPNTHKLMTSQSLQVPKGTQKGCNETKSQLQHRKGIENIFGDEGPFYLQFPSKPKPASQ